MEIKKGFDYFLRNLLKILPDFWGSEEGEASGGRVREDFTAFAGTARGERVVAVVGRGPGA